MNFFVSLFPEKKRKESLYLENINTSFLWMLPGTGNGIHERNDTPSFLSFKHHI